MFLKKPFLIIILLLISVSFVFLLKGEETFVCETEKVVDVDGNVYRTVSVGEQCWMAENLKTTKFSDGRDIPQPLSNISWRETGEVKKGAYACYDNTEKNCDVYGALYNIYAVIEGICPEGWYVPTDDDWKDFEREMGTKEDEIDLLYWRGENIATKISGEAHLWKDQNVAERRSFNATGFGAVPGGYRLSNGVYSWLGQRANFWSGTVDASGWRRTILPESSESVRRTAAAKNIGFSVRCIKE